ncbi:MAG: sugar transferase [Saprospirales bacterium]|nr:sugar transferase [Saprospirales bacterium]MBK8491148.1 sugar transferase [Saprospirales bacterium]
MYPFWKNMLDRLCSGIALIILSPAFLLITLWVKVDSKGPALYRQQRVGQGGRSFWLFKFRTMRPAADLEGLLTVGGRDPRVTRSGYFLRKYKLDELPQLWNVLKGDMSIVGPRPEVEKYVKLYTETQRKVLLVKPGLTDLASLRYFEESNLLAQSPDPEQTYIREIMPAKLELNREYIERQSLGMDLRIILRTLLRIVES